MKINNYSKNTIVKIDKEKTVKIKRQASAEEFFLREKI